MTTQITGIERHVKAPLDLGQGEHHDGGVDGGDEHAEHDDGETEPGVGGGDPGLRPCGTVPAQPVAPGRRRGSGGQGPGGAGGRRRRLKAPPSGAACGSAGAPTPPAISCAGPAGVPGRGRPVRPAARPVANTTGGPGAARARGSSGLVATVRSRRHRAVHRARPGDGWRPWPCVLPPGGGRGMPRTERPPRTGTAGAWPGCAPGEERHRGAHRPGRRTALRTARHCRRASEGSPVEAGCANRAHKPAGTLPSPTSAASPPGTSPPGTSGHLASGHLASGHLASGPGRAMGGGGRWRAPPGTATVRGSGRSPWLPATPRGPRAGRPPPPPARLPRPGCRPGAAPSTPGPGPGGARRRRGGRREPRPAISARHAGRRTRSRACRRPRPGGGDQRRE